MEPGAKKKSYGRTYKGIIRSGFLIGPDGTLAAAKRNVKADRTRKWALAELDRAGRLRRAHERAARPLEGIRVLDLRQILAGPYCTMVLGDLGADVVKVSGPAAATEAVVGPADRGRRDRLSLQVNRSKRSIAIDLKDPDGPRGGPAAGCLEEPTS